MTASWLQDCGLLIDAGGLVGPAHGNPKGHYEDFEMMLLHRSEFLAQRPRSRGWQLSSPSDLWFTGHRLAEAAALVRSRNERLDQWGWKDPRSLPFLRQWQQLEPNLRVMILWRPMDEVAASLLRRSAGRQNKDFKVRARTAISTWTAYNELAVRYTEDNRDTVSLVPLSRVLDDGESVVEDLRQRLGMDLRSSAVTARFEADLLHDAELGALLQRPWLRRRVAEARVLEQRLATLSQR